MDIVRPDAWISRTGQKWKLVVFAGIVAGSAFQFVLAFAFGNPAEAQYSTTQTRLVLLLGGTLAGLAALVWLSLAFRCPACGARVGWFLIRNADAGTWFAKLIADKECTACVIQGHTDETQK